MAVCQPFVKRIYDDDDDDDDDISYNIKFTPKTFRTVYSKTVLVKLS